MIKIRKYKLPILMCNIPKTALDISQRINYQVTNKSNSDQNFNDLGQWCPSFLEA